MGHSIILISEACINLGYSQLYIGAASITMKAYQHLITVICGINVCAAMGQMTVIALFGASCADMSARRRQGYWCFHCDQSRWLIMMTVLGMTGYQSLRSDQQ